MTSFMSAPEFEVERLRELITVGNYVRTWQEHESPYALMAGILRGRLTGAPDRD